MALLHAVWYHNNNHDFYYDVGAIDLDVEIPERRLGEIADLMTEWEGQISDKLKLRASDVEEIKTKYTHKLKLQKWGILFCMP